MKKKFYTAPVTMAVKIQTPFQILGSSTGGTTEEVEIGGGSSAGGDDGGSGDSGPTLDDGGLPWGD